MNSSVKPVKSVKTNDKQTLFSDVLKNALKGTLISMIFSVAVILLFALISKELKVSSGVNAVINQIIKIAGIIAASFFSVKGLPDRQWLCGGLSGIMYTLLSYLIFSLVSGVFGNVVLLFSNMLTGLLVGMVFAIIMVSFLKGERRPRPGRRARTKQIRVAK